MKLERSVWAITVIIVSSLIPSCSANKEQIKWHYVQEIMEEPGRDPVPVISVKNWNAQEVVFNVEGDFTDEYFFMLDGDELISKPVYWAGAVHRRVFQIKIAAKAGSLFKEGKKYRLAADEENPEIGGNMKIVNDQFQCLYIGEFTLTADKYILSLGKIL